MQKIDFGFRTVSVDIYRVYYAKKFTEMECFRTVSVDIYPKKMETNIFQWLCFRTVSVDIYLMLYNLIMLINVMFSYSIC